MAKVSQFLRLGTGAKMPALGLGTFQNIGDSLQTAVDYALSVGYRHIDTAAVYRNEECLGEILNDNIRNGKVQRKDLFLTTKVPAYLIGSESDILNSCLQSLDRLKTKYVDMLLIHMPFGYLYGPDNERNSRIMAHYDIVKAWKTMEYIVDGGYARAIGVSNFTCEQISRVWDSATIKPANLQLECHAYLQQRELRDFCHKKGIVVTAYAPLGAPARRPVDILDGDKVLLEDQVVKDIARSIGKTEGQVLLHFLLKLGVVPIPKSSNLQRLKENLEALTGNIDLDSASMEKLKMVNCNLKYYRFEWAQKHPEFSYNEPF